MPNFRSPLTFASFLKSKPPDPSPPRKPKGKKRRFSLSPTLPDNSSSKKASLSVSPLLKSNDSTLDSFSHSKTSPLPTFLPYQLRSKKNRSPTNVLSSPSLFVSSMDNSLLENEVDDVESFNPTIEEAEALLRDDPVLEAAGSNASPQDSPTSAVKAAIEAQIAEGMNDEILNFDANSKTNATQNNAKNDSINPAPRAIPKPLPLFPNGLPFPNGGSKTQAAKSQPLPPPPVASRDPRSKPTYAAKARTPPKPREMVDNILFVYSTWTAKAPLTPGDWGRIDDFLIGEINGLDPANPRMIRIANSGYDSGHKCGFIACRDLDSANWCKASIHSLGGSLSGKGGFFRAWSKGEQPETRLCRLFFPHRFDKICEDQLVPLLKRHNPPFQSATLFLKGSEIVQGGRAVYLEMDTAAYSYVKGKHHKVEFTMMDIDCQIYIPPSKKSQSQSSPQPLVPGVTKLPPATQSSATAGVTANNPTSAAPSSATTDLITKSSVEPTSSKPPAVSAESNKRDRKTDQFIATDASKKRNTKQNANNNNNKNKCK